MARDYGKVLPEFWTDHNGKSWKVPTILGRLKFRIPCHAALREFVFYRDAYRCVLCGCDDATQLVADHILSRARGGQHHPSNLRTLCKSCNSTKACLEEGAGGTHG